MERFSPSNIDAITLVAVAVTVFGYLLFAYKHQRRMLKDRADAFLRYRADGTKEKAIDAKLLRASLMASAFSLASAIYVYIDWAATDGLFALWSPISWSLGALVLYMARNRVFSASRRAWTLHAYLGDVYENASLRRASSLVTSAVFLLQVAAEVYVGIAVLTVFVGPEIPAWLLSVVVCVVFVSYTIVGGLPSVLITDRIQYRLTAFALLVAAVVLFDQGGATAVAKLRASFSETFAPSGTTWIVLFGLFALNLPLFITDMSVWQRIGASESREEVGRGLGTFALSLSLWMSLLVCLGAGFSVFFEPATGMSPAQGLLGYFRDSLVFPLLLVGFVAALLSTGDTFLIASVQTIVADWTFYPTLRGVDFEAQKLPKSTHKAMLGFARTGIVVLGLGSVIIGYVCFLLIPRLLDLLFVVFGAQTALGVSVVWALWGKADKQSGTAALWSVLVGGAMAVTCLLLALAGVEFMGVGLGLWAPILTLASSITAFFLKRAIRR